MALKGMCDYVAGAVKLRTTAQGAQFGEHPFGAFGFKESRRGDTAQLQMALIDPLLLSHKESEAIAHGGAIG